MPVGKVNQTQSQLAPLKIHSVHIGNGIQTNEGLLLAAAVKNDKLISVVFFQLLPLPHQN
jgi:hypothetical protein